MPCSLLKLVLWSNFKKLVLPNNNDGLGGTDTLKLAKSEIELPRREWLLCVRGYTFVPLERNSEGPEASVCSQTVALLSFGHVLRPYFTQNDVLCPTRQSVREIGMLQMATVPPPSFSHSFPQELSGT